MDPRKSVVEKVKHLVDEIETLRRENKQLRNDLAKSQNENKQLQNQLLTIPYAENCLLRDEIKRLQRTINEEHCELMAGMEFEKQVHPSCEESPLTPVTNDSDNDFDTNAMLDDSPNLGPQDVASYSNPFMLLPPPKKLPVQSPSDQDKQPFFRPSNN